MVSFEQGLSIRSPVHDSPVPLSTASMTASDREREQLVQNLAPSWNLLYFTIGNNDLCNRDYRQRRIREDPISAAKDALEFYRGTVNNLSAQTNGQGWRGFKQYIVRRLIILG